MIPVDQLPIPVTDNAKSILGKEGTSPANIFLSIVRRKNCVGNLILASSGLDTHGFASDFRQVAGQANSNTPQLEELLACAVSIAIRTKPSGQQRPYLGTEHLLLALLRLYPGILDAIAATAGISSEPFNEKIQANYAKITQATPSQKIERIHIPSVEGYECYFCGYASSSSRTECENCGGMSWLVWKENRSQAIKFRQRECSSLLNTLRSSFSRFIRELPAALARMFRSDEVVIWCTEGEPVLIANSANDTKVKDESQSLPLENRGTQLITNGDKATFFLEIELLGFKVFQFAFENKQSLFLQTNADAITAFMRLFSELVNRIEARKKISSSAAGTNLYCLNSSVRQHCSSSPISNQGVLPCQGRQPK